MSQPEWLKRSKPALYLEKSWQGGVVAQLTIAARFLPATKIWNWVAATLLMLAIYAPAQADNPCSGGDDRVARPIAATLQPNVSAFNPDGRFEVKMQSNADLIADIYVRHAVGSKELFRAITRLKEDLQTVVVGRLPASEGLGFLLQVEDGGSGYRQVCTYGFRFQNGVVSYRTLAARAKTREGGIFAGDVTDWKSVLNQTQPASGSGKVNPTASSASASNPAAETLQSAANSSGGKVHTYWPRAELEVDEKGCRRHPTNALYNKRIQVLGTLALQKDNPCLTTAYLEEDYKAGGNEVHAGIDFRAKKSIDKVYAIADGEIAVGSSFDGKTRSTLIIETPGKRYKILYLHMSSLAPDIQEGQNVKVGKSVKVGDWLGVAGDVGLGPGGSGPHLHIELWHVSAPQYDQFRALAGANGNCTASDQPGRCDAAAITHSTSDPAGLPKLDEEKTAEAKLPPLPLIVPSSKVVTAYGTGSWELRKATKLFSAAKTSSVVIKVLPKGTKVEAQQIEFHVLRYRISEAVRATSIEVGNAYKPKKLSLLQGDVIAEFLYTGDEGANNIIFRERPYPFFQDFASDDVSRQLNPFYDTELWARVKTKDGMVGWLQDPHANGMSRYE